MTDRKSLRSGGLLLVALSTLATLAGWASLALDDSERGAAERAAVAPPARLAPGDPTSLDIPEVVSVDTALPPRARRPDVVSVASRRGR